jgi:hypothetical protein
MQCTATRAQGRGGPSGRWQPAPRQLVTDKLRSYGAAFRRLQHRVLTVEPVEGGAAAPRLAFDDGDG